MAIQIDPGINIQGALAIVAPAVITAVSKSVTPVSATAGVAVTGFYPFLSVTNGVAPYTFYVQSGTLPTGITLDSVTGQVTGTPTVSYSAADVVFGVRDLDGVSATVTVTVNFTVNQIIATAGATTTSTTNQNVAMTSFSPFSAVSGGTTPYTYYVSSGTLPAGITINSSTGLVSGTPTAAYSAANVTFSVKDANNIVSATTSTVSFTVASTSYSVTYLMVAGGGGGGGGYSGPGYGFSTGGGGGGGGYLTGTKTLNVGTTYTAVAGGGGSGIGPQSIGPADGTQGTPSTFPGLTTAVGGGFGAGTAWNFNGSTGGSGGSGGGGSSTGSFPTSSPTTGWAGGAGTPGQGSAGGSGGPSSVSPPSASPIGGSSNRTSGSGGGYSGTGTYTSQTSLGSPPGSPITAVGGAGAFNSITGSPVGYAGGGAVGTFGASTPSYGGGASGGSGTARTGGGGGGGIGSSSGGNGGSGVVILSVPTPNYTGTYSPPSTVTITTPAAAPGQTIIKFNGSGTYTA